MILFLLAQAQQDLDAVEDPLLGRIVRRLSVLTQFPELGERMPRPYTEYRSTVVDLFRIVYRIRADQVVEIAFIRDCRRRLPERS